jgi:asparagine synthase (glutamine-hydrolysing)
MGALIFMFYKGSKTPISIQFTKSFLNMQKRGPDDTSYVVESSVPFSRLNMDQVRTTLSKREIAEYSPYTFIFGYHRLCINDKTLDGSQPFEDPILHQIKKYPELRNRPKRMLLCNGEIYNYKDLKAENMFSEKDLQSNSDVEIIMPLYIKYGIEETLKQLNGDFSFVLTENLNTFDVKTINIYIVRDILGIKPIYMIKDVKCGLYMFTSELKGVPNYIFSEPSIQVCEVPPGTYWSYNNSIVNNSSDEFIRYSDWNFYKSLEHCSIKTADPLSLSSIYQNIKEKLRKSIITRYNSKDNEHVVGVLLSGGFDSSIILSVLIEYLSSVNHNFEKYPLYAFTIGNDIEHANNIVEFLEEKYKIDIKHHFITVYKTEQLISNVEDIIYKIETYDPKMIRGGIVFDILLKYIKENTNVKIVFTGEGLDELCGYSNFNTLTDAQFQNKSVKLLKHLSKFDILRADKIAGSHGLELRHPFLDRDFIEYILSIHPKLKRPQIYKTGKPAIEKYIVRKSFDNGNYLPSSVLWNPLQEITSSFGELETNLKNYYDTKISDQEYYSYIKNQNNMVKGRIPKSKEELYYKKCFQKHFKQTSHLVNNFWNDLWI